MNFIRIYAIVFRQLVLFRRNTYRVFEVFYWAILELFLWGFITMWLRDLVTQDYRVNIVMVLLGALIFWDFFSRVQTMLSVSFLEDIWTRNLVNIIASPISYFEFLLGLIITSFIGSAISIASLGILSYLFYSFNIWKLGLFLLPFIANLFIFGWTLSFIVIGVVLRFGHSASVLTWSITVLIQPLSAVFYPVSVLPLFLQKIAVFLPTMYIFEGMRKILLGQSVSPDYILKASLLNIIYFSLGIAFFYLMLRLAKKKGFLARLATE